MKKLNLLAIILIIANCLSICPLAYEATEEERGAAGAAIRFFNQSVLMSQETEENVMSFYDSTTINFYNGNTELKNQILAKAKEYENEIRFYHRYHYYEDNQTMWEYTDRVTQNGSIPISEFDEEEYEEYIKNKPPTKQYDNIPIEDVITSFPDYRKKKDYYYKELNYYYNKKHGTHYGEKEEITYESFSIVPSSVYVSESGFAYVATDSTNVLLYKHETSELGWIVLDVSNFFDGFDEKYRFHIDDLDIEKDLEERGIKPVGEKDTQIYPTAEEESDNKVDNSPQKSEPANYIPWVICTAEGVAIIALVIALILKKKK